MHHEILPPEQLRVWQASAAAATRWGAYLAGGTAVALYLGHRRSIDFDWFTPRDLAPAELLADVTAMGFPVEVSQNVPGTFLARVLGVSFTVFRYRYPLLGPTTPLDGCQVAGLRDLAAMKLLAIYQRGTKKDFIDVHELLSRAVCTLADMLQAFRDKFAVADVREVLRALHYFGDAEAMPMPHMLAARTWEAVKAGIAEALATLPPAADPAPAAPPATRAAPAVRPVAAAAPGRLARRR